MAFRKIITRFCQLPLILLPIILLGAVARYASGGNMTETYFFVRTLIVTLCVTFSMGALIKFMYYKERPEPRKFTNRWNKIDASSFPSIHTAYASVFLCLGLTLSKSIPAVPSALLILFLLVFYVLIARSRIVLKKHFFIDVVFGTVLGLIGVIFCLLHMPSIVASFHLFFGL